MNKKDIFQILLDQHNEVEDLKAFILFNQDHNGDMEKRESLSTARFQQQCAIRNSARMLLGDKMYEQFYPSCKTITQTSWYKTRKFNHDGTALTEGQINVRDWAIARDAERAA